VTADRFTGSGEVWNAAVLGTVSSRECTPAGWTAWSPMNTASRPHNCAAPLARFEREAGARTEFGTARVA